MIHVIYINITHTIYMIFINQNLLEWVEIVKQDRQTDERKRKKRKRLIDNGSLSSKA